MNAPVKTHSQGQDKVTFPIEGMTCASCVGRVEKALKAVPGVASANVNLATEKAEISLSAPISRDVLADAVRDVGYDVPSASIDLAIIGMTCASCVGRVEKALKAVPGVATATVNLATERAHVTGGADLAALIETVAQTGYEAKPIDRSGDEHAETAARKDADEAALKRDLTLAAALTVPVFILEMGSHLIPGMHELIMNTIGMQTNWYIQFGFTLLILSIPGIRFYTHGFPALLRGAPDMNSLVAVGTSAAFLYSIVATFAPSLLPAGTVNVYFEAAAVIVTLILLGRYLEARAKGRTSEAIKRLVGLQPKMARVRRDGQTTEIAVERCRSGRRYGQPDRRAGVRGDRRRRQHDARADHSHGRGSAGIKAADPGRGRQGDDVVRACRHAGRHGNLHRLDDLGAGTRAHLRAR